MTFAIRAEMNGEILAGALINVARNNPVIFTVTPDLDAAGNLQSGSFTLSPSDNLGIEMLMGKTFVNSDLPFELQIDVKAKDWQGKTEAEKNETLLLIFKPLVDLYNQTNKSQAQIIQKS
jgi:hypothetical protein